MNTNDPDFGKKALAGLRAILDRKLTYLNSAAEVMHDAGLIERADELVKACLDTSAPPPELGEDDRRLLAMYADLGLVASTLHMLEDALGGEAAG